MFQFRMTIVCSTLMNNQQLLGQITERKPNANSSMQVSSIEPTQNQLHF